MTDERRWRLVVNIETVRELLVRGRAETSAWTKDERDLLAKVTAMLDDKLWELRK